MEKAKDIFVGVAAFALFPLWLPFFFVRDFIGGVCAHVGHEIRRGWAEWREGRRGC